MKKVIITGIALLGIMQLSAQSAVDSTGYKSKKLSIDEINLVSSYYKQDGNNAAVTGGVGSEKLTDIANAIDVKLIRYDSKDRKHTLDIEAGIDYYTSASSDMIDLKANSSASSADVRIYPSLNYTIENEQKGTTLGAGISSSSEFDYQSFGGNLSFSKKTKNRNGEFTAKIQTYLDQVKLIAPIELRTSSSGRHDNYPSASRNTFAGSLNYSQIINDHFQVMFLADIVKQNGYLSLPFHRVYFDDGSVHQENLPGNRLKFPLAFRASYFLGDYIILKAYYRFYTDDWGLKSNTANIEVPIKLTTFVSISPFYRYYSQSAINYFEAYKKHNALDEFYTSNYDVSKFNSNFLGMGFKYTPLKGVFGIKEFNTLEIRYGHYTKNIGMNSDIISIAIKYK